MKGFDAPRREGQRLALSRRHPGRGRFSLGIGDAQARRVSVDPVEFPGVLDQRDIAAGAHVGHDVGGDPVDILVSVPIAPEEGREFLFETRRRGVEPLRRHG